MPAAVVNEALLMNRILAAAVSSVATAVGVSTVWYAHQKLVARASQEGVLPFPLIAVFILLPLVPVYAYAWRRWNDGGPTS